MTLAEYFAGDAALAGQWDGEKNDVSPEGLSTGSREKVWWKCEKGHSYRSAVFARVTIGRGCPYCAGQRPLVGETDLATVSPAVAALWDGEKNAPLTPQDVTAGSHKSVWWRCRRGHSWRAAVFSLTKGGSGCPYCAGKLVIPARRTSPPGCPSCKRSGVRSATAP